jgi:hypothetical protein
MTAATRREPKVRHGRRGTWMLWALADPALNARAGEAGARGAAWPHLAQVCRVERERVDCRTGEVEREVSYAVTSRPPHRADAGRLLAALRGHWGIENKLHHVRDVTFDEDRSQIRTGAAPQATAACRNLAIALPQPGHRPAAAGRARQHRRGLPHLRRPPPRRRRPRRRRRHRGDEMTLVWLVRGLRCGAGCGRVRP